MSLNLTNRRPFSIFWLIPLNAADFTSKSDKTDKSIWICQWLGKQALSRHILSSADRLSDISVLQSSAVSMLVVKFGSEVENQRLLLMAAISFVVSKNTEVAIHKQKRQILSKV